MAYDPGNKTITVSIETTSPTVNPLTLTLTHRIKDGSHWDEVRDLIRLLNGKPFIITGQFEHDPNYLFAEESEGIYTEDELREFIKMLQNGE